MFSLLGSIFINVIGPAVAAAGFVAANPVVGVVHTIMEYQCPDTEIINKTQDPWNATDQAGLDRAKWRCGAIYNKSPCLKKFIKKDINAYHAICGRK